MSFNKNSINFDFFKSICPDKVLTHLQFLELNIDTISQLRLKDPTIIYDLLSYEELGNQKIKYGKILLNQ